VWLVLSMIILTMSAAVLTITEFSPYFTIPLDEPGRSGR
jgi:hypothetical protein